MSERTVSTYLWRFEFRKDPKDTEAPLVEKFVYAETNEIATERMRERLDTLFPVAYTIESVGRIEKDEQGREHRIVESRYEGKLIADGVPPRETRS